MSILKSAEGDDMPDGNLIMAVFIAAVLLLVDFQNFRYSHLAQTPVKADFLHIFNIVHKELL